MLDQRSGLQHPTEDARSDRLGGHHSEQRDATGVRRGETEQLTRLGLVR